MTYKNTRPKRKNTYVPPSDFYADFNPANDTIAGAATAARQLNFDNVSLYKDHAPEEPDALYRLGRQYLEERQYDQAIAQFNRLLQIDQKNPDTLNNLGFCLLETGRLGLALKSYRLAQYLAPQDSRILLGVASCYEVQGNFDKAIAVYEDVLKKEPNHLGCMYNLVLIGDHRLDSPLARQLKKLYQSSRGSHRSRAIICFSLAKIYETHGEYQRAFAYYKEGNRLQFSTLFYDETALFHRLDALEAAFDSRLFSELGDLGSSDATPIFVLGMPRSGTSLVEQILASHAQVHGAGEVNAMTDIVARLIPQLTGQDDPRAMVNLNPEAYASLAEHYLKGLRSQCPDKKLHIVDKMPSNFFNIGLIRLLLPHARIIHCVRDPMATCWSLYRQYFSENHPYSYNQTALGRFYLRYQQLMRHWDAVLPEAIYEVRYEQLVENPQQVIPALLEYCGLPRDEKCFEFYDTQRPINTASMRQVRRPLYKSSLQSWKSVTHELAELRQTLRC